MRFARWMASFSELDKMSDGKRVVPSHRPGFPPRLGGMNQITNLVVGATTSE